MLQFQQTLCAPEAQVIRHGPRTAQRRNRGEGGEPDEALALHQLTLLALARRWSGVDRAQRYRQRNGGAGGGADESNPLPDLIDPITLEPVVTPAISPFGHVMGLATWKVRQTSTLETCQSALAGHAGHLALRPRHGPGHMEGVANPKHS